MNEGRKNVPIDAGLHREVKVEAARSGESIRQFIEEAVQAKLHDRQLTLRQETK